MPSKRELDKEKMFRKIMPSSAAQKAEGHETTASESEASAQNPPPSVSVASDSTGEGGKLSEDAIAALFAQQQGTAEPPAEAPAPVQPEPQPVVEAPAAPAGEGGKLSEDAIAALFAQQQGMAEPPAEAPAPAFLEKPAEPDAPAKSPKIDVAALYAQQHAKTLAEIEKEPTTTDPGTIEAAPLDAVAPKFSSEALPAVSPPAEAASSPQESFDNDTGGIPRPINLAEILAEQCYERYRQRLAGCPCEKCRDDVLGMALNRIRPHYITSDQMDPSLLGDRALVTECITALIHAIFMVKRNPKHDPAEAARQ